MSEVARPIVVKLGGALLDRPESSPALFAAIARLHRARPGGVIIVHGGGAAVDRHLAALGMTSERREGIRITPPEQMEVIAGVLAGAMNTRLVGVLRAAGLPAVGLSLGAAEIECRKTSAFSFDPGRVGEVVGGRGRLLSVLLDEGFVPVLSSIGLDAEGAMLNVNADEAAAGVARVIAAAELVLLTDVAGVLGADGVLLPRLDGAAIEHGIAAGWISGGMIAKVRGAAAAARSAATPVRIASWSDPAPILALAEGSRGSAGTCIEIDLSEPVAEAPTEGAATTS